MSTATAFHPPCAQPTRLERLLLRSSAALETLANARMERRSSSALRAAEQARHVAAERGRDAAAVVRSGLLPR